MRAGRCYALLGVALALSLLWTGAAQTSLLEFDAVENGPAITGRIPIPSGADGVRLVCAPLKCEGCPNAFSVARNGTFTYLPGKNMNTLTKDVMDLIGVAGVKSVTASDGTTSDVQVTDVSKSYVYIKPVNQAPQFDAPFVTTDGKAQLWINSASQAVPINGTKVYELPASDVDGDALTFTLTAAPKHGTVTILNSQSFSYKADQGFSGIDQFDITVDDHLGTPGHPHTTDALSTVSTVFIQVGQYFTVPMVMPYSGVAIMGKSYQIAIQRTSMTDETKSTSLVYAITTPPSLGIAQLACNGFEVTDPVECTPPTNFSGSGPRASAYLRYVPIPNKDGLDSLTLSVSNLSGSNTAVFTFQVHSVPVPPVIISAPTLRAPVFINPNGVPNNAYADIPLNLSNVSSMDTTGPLQVVVNVGDTLSLGFRGNMYAGLMPNPSRRRGLQQVQAPDVAAGSAAYVPDPSTNLLSLADSNGLVYLTTQSDNAVHVYYQSPVGAKIDTGIVFQVASSNAISAPATAKISVTCTPGTKAVVQQEVIGSGSSQQSLSITVCEPCPAGTYSVAGSSVCEKCPTGQYNPLTGQSACVDCPANATSNEGAADVSQCFCLAGYFGLVRTVDALSLRPQCQACQDDGLTGRVICDAEGQQLPRPQPGIWLDKWATWQTRQQVLRSCIPPEACRGGSDVTATDVWKEDTCAVSGSQGYQGRACSQCREGHFRTGGSCTRCPAVPLLVLYYAVLAALALAPIVFRVYMSETGKEWAYFHVALIFMQFNGLLQKLRVGYPTKLMALLQFQSLFMFDVEAFHLECIFGPAVDARTKITVAYAIPVLCLGLSVVGAFAKILHIRVQRRRLDFMRTDETQRFKYLLLTIQKRKGGRVEDYRLSHINPPFVPLALGIFLMYVQIIYPGVARQVLSPYDCVRDPLTGEHFMESAPYIRCSPPSPAEVEARQSLLWGYGIRAEFDGDWRILQRYTWIMLPALVAGMPLLMVSCWLVGACLGRQDQTFVWRSRRHKDRIKKAAGDRPDHHLWYKAMLAQFSFFYSPRWTGFFALATVLQFLALLCQTLGNSLRTEGITLQLLAMFFLSVFPYFLLESFSNPFLDDKLQYLHQFFNFTNALSVWNSTALLGATSQVSVLVSVVAFAESAVAFAVGILTVWSVAYEYLEQRIQRLRTRAFFFFSMLQYRYRTMVRARRSLAAQRWAAAISKARFIARMRISERDTESAAHKLADLMGAPQGAQAPQAQFNPLSWLYKDTPLSGVVGGGGSVAGGGGMSSAFGGGTTGVGALGREMGVLDAAVDDAIDAQGRPLKPTTHMADLVFKAFSQAFFVPHVADAMDQLLSWAVLKDTWSNYGVLVDKAWVGKTLLKVLKYRDFKMRVDKENAAVTSMESKLRKNVRGPLLRFMIERESRADNVEAAQVLEMVDDLLGDTLDPDLWNYGEAIRNAATGKTAEEQFLEGGAPDVDAGDGEEGAERHQARVDQVQQVLQKYLLQFRARRAAERVQLEEGELEPIDEEGLDMEEADPPLGDSEAGGSGYTPNMEDPYNPVYNPAARAGGSVGSLGRTRSTASDRWVRASSEVSSVARSRLARVRRGSRGDSTPPDGGAGDDASELGVAGYGPRAGGGGPGSVASGAPSRLAASVVSGVATRVSQFLGGGGGGDSSIG